MHVGKFLNGYGSLSPPTQVPPGFNDWHGTVDPSTYRFWGYTVNENGSLRSYGAAGEPELYSTDFLARRADELIAAAAPSRAAVLHLGRVPRPHAGAPREADDPSGHPTPAVPPRYANFFGSVALPLPASFNEVDMSDKPAAMRRRPPIGVARAAAIREGYQQRLESLLAVDDAVASIVGTLRATGELDDTLILFTSDNGFFYGEHRARVVLVYEPSIQALPLLRGPGVPPGTTTRQLVTNADLAPTILDAARPGPGASRTVARCWTSSAIRASSGGASCCSRAAAHRA